jgi:hypothetical protein
MLTTCILYNRELQSTADKTNGNHYLTELFRKLYFLMASDKGHIHSTAVAEVNIRKPKTTGNALECLLNHLRKNFHDSRDETQPLNRTASCHSCSLATSFEA